MLTDFLVRSFQRTVLAGLGLDRHPELWPDYFGHYRRVVWLAQDRSAALQAEAEEVAARFGLPLTVIETGTARWRTNSPGSSVTSLSSDPSDTTAAGWLAQSRDPALDAEAEAVAGQFGLPLTVIETGTARLERALGLAPGRRRGAGRCAAG